MTRTNLDGQEQIQGSRKSIKTVSHDRRLVERTATRRFRKTSSTPASKGAPNRQKTQQGSAKGDQDRIRRALHRSRVPRYSYDTDRTPNTISQHRTKRKKNVCPTYYPFSRTDLARERVPTGAAYSKRPLYALI